MEESAEAIRRALQTYSGEMLVVVDERGVVGPVRAGASLLGWRDEEDDRPHIADLVHADDIGHVLEFVEQVRANPGMRASTFVRVHHRDGRWLPLDAEVIDAREALGGFVVRLHGAGQEADTADRLHRFMPLPEVVSFGILSADDRGGVVYANEAATDLFSRPVEALQGSGWLDAIVEDDRGRVVEAISTMRPEGNSTVMCRVAMGEGFRWLHCRFRPRTRGAGTSRQAWVATVNDVTSERELAAELAHLATHDSLTGLPNRALMRDRLDIALARLRRQGGTVTVSFLDLDRFKPVNDEHGHAVGDALLVEVANRLRSVVRATDTAARLGGDEFVVISEGLTREEAERMARRIADAVDAPMTLGEREVRITGCVGVTLTDDPAQSADDLLAEADEAMYQAKRCGTRIALAGGLRDSA